MKCTVRYEIDGDTDFFIVEGRDAETCRLDVNSEVERLGLTQEKNNISIDVQFDNKRSALFLGIPCWYYVDTCDIEGRSLFYQILLTMAFFVTSIISRISEFTTGRMINFPVKFKEIE
jgi:hypothetical protein